VPKEGEGKSLTTSQLEKAGAVAHARSGKTCKSGSERKTPQERGEDPLPT
jgi:hypothetical protein